MIIDYERETERSDLKRRVLKGVGREKKWGVSMFLNFSGFEFNAANAVGDMVSKHMLKKSLQKLYRLTIHIIVYTRLLINIS